MLGQQLDVGLALAQRRHAHTRNADAVIQVATEAPGLDIFQQITIRHRQQAHIDAAWLGFAEAVDHAFFEGAQQNRLQLHRQVADLVQAQGAAVRQLEASGAPFVGGTRVRPAHVAEELAADQLLRRRTTVEGDERAAALLVAVNGTREKFFANAGLAPDQHGNAPPAEQFCPVNGSAQGGAVADQVVEAAA